MVEHSSHINESQFEANMLSVRSRLQKRGGGLSRIM